MQTQTMNNETAADKKLFIKMVVDAWETANKKFSKLVDMFSEEELSLEVAPGRNRGIYLAGHLVAVHDAMLPLLGFGERLYPQLEPVFLSKPDKSGDQVPSLEALKKYRDDINAKLTDNISRLQPADWFTRHTSVSEADFAKEPHRNKLNVLINRTNHLNYHLGQLIFLEKGDKSK